MKTILILTAFSLYSFVGLSQNWKEVKSTDTVKISVKEIHYQNVTNDIDHQRLIFKYENLTSTPIELHFNRELIYNNKKSSQEEDFSIQIPANGSLEYNELENNTKSYYIFKKDNNGWIKRILDNYSIIHLKVNQL
jgi:uncharacterized membrane protein